VATGDKIRIGTSGYSFHDWKGPFYPETLKAGAELEYYSSFFDVAEINSSYYKIPSPETFADMVRRTDGDFEFVVKLHKSMTHDRDANLRPFEDFSAAIHPLKESGRLLGLLAQFPWSFKNSEDNRSYLDWLRLKFEGENLFAEFRHDSWISDETLDWMREKRIGYCSVDEPLLEGLVPAFARATGPTGYVRFHGRNDKDWWQPRPGSDRYLYDYSEKELDAWVPKIRSLASQTERVLLFFNNCHFGNAPKNARAMKKLLGLPDVRKRRAGELFLDD
jgi:uncharacterized protein YecE (DUF72 family)